MITPDNYLNIVDIIINEIIGSIWLALFLGLIVIAFLSVKYSLSPRVSVGLSVFFIFFILSLYFNQLLIAIAILVLGLVIYITFSKWIN